MLLSAYDPLGLLVNSSTLSKGVLKNVWRRGVAWDDPILTLQAGKGLYVLPKIKGLKVLRCYLQRPNYNNFVVGVHAFVDATGNGYPAVSYLIISSNNNTIVPLVAESRHFSRTFRVGDSSYWRSSCNQYSGQSRNQN